MMRNTQELIDSLAQDVRPVKPLASPARLMLRLGMVMIIYAIGVGFKLGLRPDLTAQLHRPFYLVEILLLAFIAVTSLSGAVYMVFPDQYQHPAAARLPLLSLAAFVIVLLVQMFLPADARMVIPAPEEVHGMDCTLCIALVAALPSALMFVFVRKGAGAYPPLSGIFIVFAAAALGCLMLRLSEPNDSLQHITVWHYLPTLVFAGVGAFAGKVLLTW